MSVPRIEATIDEDGVVGVTIENCDNDDVTLIIFTILVELERNGYVQNVELANKIMEDYNESRKN